MGHKKYNPSASSTSHDLGKTFTLVYGGGSNASGEQYTDVVTIAGLAVRGAMFFFSFPTKRLHVYMSRHRQSHRRLAPQTIIIQSLKSTISRPMA